MIEHSGVECGDTEATVRDKAHDGTDGLYTVFTCVMP